MIQDDLPNFGMFKNVAMKLWVILLEPPIICVYAL
jgi:hypothetical protein